MASFEYISIIGDPAKAVLKVAYIDGISTKHDSDDTDRGRLYASLVKTGDTYTLDIFSNVAKDAGSRVLTGQTNSLQAYFELTEVDSSGMSGRAWIDSFESADANIILLPTFAVDRDVVVSAGECERYPGYDDEEGFAEFHAQAVQEIMTSGLPMAVPSLFGGAGLAAFVPQGQNSKLPDLTKIANPDQLRVAQKHLVKALSAEQAEHLEEWALVAKAARERYDEAMQSLALGNTVDEETAVSESPVTYEVGSFRRV